MKHLLLTLFMLLPACQASAEWLQYAETDAAVFYLETSTVRRDNHFRTAWEIQSLRQRNAAGAHSRMLLYEYECQLALFRILAVRVHAEAMAGGRKIASDDTPGPWDYATPGTPVAESIRIVCAPKTAIHD